MGARFPLGGWHSLNTQSNPGWRSIRTKALSRHSDPDGHDCVFTSGNYAYVARGDCTGIANGKLGDRRETWGQTERFLILFLYAENGPYRGG